MPFESLLVGHLVSLIKSVSVGLLQPIFVTIIESQFESLFGRFSELQLPVVMLVESQFLESLLLQPPIAMLEGTQFGDFKVGWLQPPLVMLGRPQPKRTGTGDLRSPVFMSKSVEMRFSLATFVKSHFLGSFCGVCHIFSV